MGYQFKPGQDEKPQRHEGTKGHKVLSVSWCLSVLVSWCLGVLVSWCLSVLVVQGEIIPLYAATL
jgi:hypothetical protein